MLVEMHKSQQSKSVGSNDFAASRAFAMEIIRQRTKIFPEEFFESRMEAMHQQVDQWKKTLTDIVVEGEGNDMAEQHDEAEEALGADGSSQDTSDSDSAPSSGSSQKPQDGQSMAGSEMGHGDTGAGVATLGAGPEVDTSKFDRSISEITVAERALGPAQPEPAFNSVVPAPPKPVQVLRPKVFGGSRYKHTL